MFGHDEVKRRVTAAVHKFLHVIDKLHKAELGELWDVDATGGASPAAEVVAERLDPLVVQVFEAPPVSHAFSADKGIRAIN